VYECILFSAFTHRLASLLVTNKVFVFVSIVFYIFTQYINITSTDHKLMYAIQLQSLLVYLDIPNSIF
jgi:hypothetical protein